MACSTKASNSASLRPATSRSLLKWRGAGIWGVTIRTDAGGGAGAAGAAEELWTGAGVRSWSRRFGGGDGEGVVAEAGDEVEFAALERQVRGEPVGLARGIVIHRAEPGRFEPPRGPRAHVSIPVVAVDDHRPGPVQLPGPGVECLERVIDRAGQVRPPIIPSGQHLDQLSPLPG